MESSSSLSSMSDRVLQGMYNLDEATVFTSSGDAIIKPLEIDSDRMLGRSVSEKIGHRKNTELISLAQRQAWTRHTTK